MAVRKAAFARAVTGKAQSDLNEAKEHSFDCSDMELNTAHFTETLNMVKERLRGSHLLSL